MVSVERERDGKWLLGFQLDGMCYCYVLRQGRVWAGWCDTWGKILETLG